MENSMGGPEETPPAPPTPPVTVPPLWIAGVPVSVVLPESRRCGFEPGGRSLQVRSGSVALAPGGCHGSAKAIGKRADPGCTLVPDAPFIRLRT